MPPGSSIAWHFRETIGTLSETANDIVKVIAEEREFLEEAAGCCLAVVATWQDIFLTMIWKSHGIQGYILDKYCARQDLQRTHLG